MMRFFSAGDWSRRVTGRKFNTGELVKAEFKHRLPSGFQSYFLNTRRELFKDVRVREALGLALDYEWMNRQMFYNAYQRVAGLFGNTDCQATGLPGPQELALLEPWRGKVPDAVFGPMYVPPRTDGDSSLRANLRKARELLRQAGWEIRDGVLRNARGEAFTLEYMDSNEGGVRTLSSWQRNLAKLLARPDARTAGEYWIESTRARQLSGFAFVVLSTPHSAGREAQLAVGRAYQRTHLWATANGLAMQPLNQLAERADREEILGLPSVARAAIAELLGDHSGDRAQMLFRIGVPWEDGLRSPRRPLDWAVRS